MILFLISAFVYIVENKMEDWVVKPGKKIVLKEIVNKWNNEFNYIHTSPQKDSMKNLLNYYVDNLDSLDDVANENVKSFATEFNSAIEDRNISSNELSILTLLVKKETNEKSESN